MVKEKITIQETVEFLNEILKIDPVAVTALFSLRTVCNKKLADHETVQVANLSKDYCQVGMIGVLNGLFGIDEHGWGHIAADCDNGMITGFKVLTPEMIHSFSADISDDVR